MHLSDRQLSRVFRSELDITPGDHVEVVRVEAARRLLETTTAPVERVARQAGFGTRRPCSERSGDVSARRPVRTASTSKMP
jgi:transcriptional regulator GlxA family with amidase domain